MVLLGQLGLGVVLGLVFRVRLRVSNHIKCILNFVHVSHFIHLHSVGGATVVRTERTIILRTAYRTRALNAVSYTHLTLPTNREV